MYSEIIFCLFAFELFQNKSALIKKAVTRKRLWIEKSGNICTCLALNLRVSEVRCALGDFISQIKSTCGAIGIRSNFL